MGTTLWFPVGLSSSAALQAEDGLAYPQSQFNLNCSNFTVEQLKTINLARGITGAVSLVIVTSIFLFLVLYKAYTTTLQRLFVHLTIVTCLHDVSFVMELEHQFEYYGQEQFCAFIGFFDTWAANMVYNFIIGINVFLVYTVYRQLSGDPFSRLSNSKYPRLILECTFTLLMVFLPLTYLLLPFAKDTYGMGSGGLSAACWIKDVENDCKTVQPYSQVIYVEASLVAVACIVHILFTAGIAVVFCRLACTYPYRGMKHKYLKNVRAVLLLMCFLLISVAFDSPPIVFLLVTIGENVNETESYAFWMFALIGPPISMLIYPTGFFFYLYSLKKLKWESIKRAAAEWKPSCDCKRKHKHSGRRPMTQTFVTSPSSHPPVIPSSTFFAVPYTGAFSDIDVTTREDQPLISNKDTGYSSIQANEQ